jgi:hypothetical protein
VFTLEVLVDKFGDEIAPFAVNLARNLTAAFWKYSGMADGEDGEDEDDQGAEPSLLATDVLYCVHLHFSCNSFRCHILTLCIYYVFTANAAAVAVYGCLEALKTLQPASATWL